MSASRPKAPDLGRELGAVLDRIDRERAGLAELVKERKGRHHRPGPGVEPRMRWSMIAALFVQTGGAYFGLEGVDPWDEVPPTSGAWVRSIDGGWTCHVEQFRYGHRARKATWLYAHGATYLPSLRWGSTRRSASVHGSRVGPGHRVSALQNHGRRAPGVKELSKQEASRTPEAFKAQLLAIARSARGASEAA